VSEERGVDGSDDDFPGVEISIAGGVAETEDALGEPIDLLFYRHCGSASESGTDYLVNLHFTRDHNRGPSPHASPSSDDNSSDGMNPESSATAAKRAVISKMTTTKNRTRNTGTV